MALEAEKAVVNAPAMAGANGAGAVADAGVKTGGIEQATPSEYTYGGKTYKSVDDLGKAYESLNSEHGKWTQKYGELEQQARTAAEQAQQWNKWWETVKPLWGDDVEGLLRQKMSGGRQPQVQPQQAAGDPYDGFDLMRPQEQFQKFREMFGQEVGSHFNRGLADLAKAVNDTFAQKEQWYNTYFNNHLSLLRRALEEKFRNPQFNIDKVMESAAQAMAGQMDPIQLGQQLLDSQSYAQRLEEAKKSSYEQGKKDFEQEAANKKQETVPFSGSMPKFSYNRVETGKTGKGLEVYKDSAAEAIFKKFGPQWLQR